MLGYVVPDKSELKMIEYEIYTSYYCGICHSIRDRYGQIPRLLLSYDSVFLAMLISGVDENEDEIETFRCFTNPTRKRNILKSGYAMDYAADIMILLAYYNLIDDYEDEGKIIGLVGSRYLRKAYRKIKAKMPVKAERIGSLINDMNQLEKEKTSSLDMVAEPFANIMEEVLDYDNQSQYQKAYRKIGYHLGKWIYLIDAIDDLKDDVSKKTYNPILNNFEYIGDVKSENVYAFKQSIEDRLRFNLMMYLSSIADSLKDLPLSKNKGILENVVYIGLRKKTEEILNNRYDNKRKRRENI